MPAPRGRLPETSPASFPAQDAAGDSPIVIPPEIIDIAVNSLGRFFEPISRAEPDRIARDHLNPLKAIKRGRLLERYISLESRKLLEIGSGFGTNLAVWVKQFKVDGYGVEPSGTGFGSSFLASRKLMEANGLDPDRIVDATGENLPFEDGTFDIVYSANVLEHTQDPVRVLTEAARVLKPGGILHFEMPNFLSCFEGHYMVVQPPILWRGLLLTWIRFAIRRDPAFATTLQTCINPMWCRRAVRRLRRAYPVVLLTLGEDLFLERLAGPFAFETEQVAGRVGPLVSVVRRLNFCNWIGRWIVAMQGFYPIYLTLRKD